MKFKKKISKYFTEKNVFIGIGIFLLIHWVLLVINRVMSHLVPNLFWLSHVVLLAAGIGFILRNNLVLSGSLISVILGHGLWVYDLIVLLATGSSPLNYASYVLEISFYGKFLAMHHVYLIPLLFIALWKQKKISKYGWGFSSALFAFITFSSYLFLPREHNVNCAHFICPVALEIFPFLGFLTKLHTIAYLLIMNIIIAILIFLVFNIILYYGFKLYVK